MLEVNPAEGPAVGTRTRVVSDDHHPVLYNVRNPFDHLHPLVRVFDQHHISLNGRVLLVRSWIDQNEVARREAGQHGFTRDLIANPATHDPFQDFADPGSWNRTQLAGGIPRNVAALGGPEDRVNLLDRVHQLACVLHADLDLDCGA